VPAAAHWQAAKGQPMNAIKRTAKAGKVVADYNIQQQEREEDHAAFVLLFGREPEPGEDFELVLLRPGLSEARVIRRAGQ
jgi:hypothetical protein